MGILSEQLGDFGKKKRRRRVEAATRDKGGFSAGATAGSGSGPWFAVGAGIVTSLPRGNTIPIVTPSKSRELRQDTSRGNPSSSTTEQKRFIAIGQAEAAGETELFSVDAEQDNIGQRVDGLATFTRMGGEESCISRVIKGAQSRGFCA